MYPNKNQPEKNCARHSHARLDSLSTRGNQPASAVVRRFPESTKSVIKFSGDIKRSNIFYNIHTYRSPRVEGDKFVTKLGDSPKKSQNLVKFVSTILVIPSHFHHIW